VFKRHQKYEDIENRVNTPLKANKRGLGALEGLEGPKTTK